MNKIYLFIAIMTLFWSCDATDENSGDVTVDMRFTRFDVTLTSGEQSIGVIDEELSEIALYGIADPSEIRAVEYECTEGLTLITPTPESQIGDWSVTEKFTLHYGSSYRAYTVTLPDYAPVEPEYETQATISPLDTFGCVTRFHMLDLNGDPDKASDASTAYAAFSEQGMNGIRFPLYCGDYYGGHPEEGVVVDSVYERPLASLANAVRYYAGTEPFQIFLGIKCMTSDKNEYYPDWVSTEDDYIKPDKYAQMIIDFIAFMDEKGYEINAVAIDKENVRMDIEDFKESVDSIRAMAKRLGYTVPKIVAPELLDPQGDVSSGWMNTLYDLGYEDRYDIFGNHYYQRDHTESGFAKLKYEYDLAQSDKARPQWATEPHWNGNADIYVAETAIGVMFDHTDLGLEAFMWWGYPITGSSNYKNPIMRAYSQGILHSRPIRMIDHDGEETFTKGKLQSRAYLRGDEVNVFLINVVNVNYTDEIEPVSYEDYAIELLDNFSIDGKVTVRQWRDDTDYEGEVSLVSPVKDNQFLIDIPTGSFTQLTFNISEE